MIGGCSWSLISSLADCAIRFVRPRGGFTLHIVFTLCLMAVPARVPPYCYARWSAFGERDDIIIIEEGRDPFFLDDLFEGREGFVIAVEQIVPCC